MTAKDYKSVLDTLLGEISDTYDKIAEISAKCWPVGSPISWEHHGHTQAGVVVRHRIWHDDIQLFCRNARSGKVVKVRYGEHTGLYGC